jgi:hypothetical protein
MMQKSQGKGHGMMKQNRPGHAPPRSPPRMLTSCSCDVLACAAEVPCVGSRAVKGICQYGALRMAETKEKVGMKMKVAQGGLGIVSTYSLAEVLKVGLFAGWLKEWICFRLQETSWNEACDFDLRICFSRYAGAAGLFD